MTLKSLRFTLLIARDAALFLLAVLVLSQLITLGFLALGSLF